MKESEQELHEGAQTLECSMRGVLQEQHLQKYISPQHWKSLMNGSIQVGVILRDASISLALSIWKEPPAEAAVQSISC